MIWFIFQFLGFRIFFFNKTSLFFFFFIEIISRPGQIKENIWNLDRLHFLTNFNIPGIFKNSTELILLLNRYLFTYLFLIEIIFKSQYHSSIEFGMLWKSIITTDNNTIIGFHIRRKSIALVLVLQMIFPFLSLTLFTYLLFYIKLPNSF